MKKKDIYSDHTLIIKKLERSIKFYNWNSILPFLPKGSFLGKKGKIEFQL